MGGKWNREYNYNPEKIALMDSIRTMTLMSGSGVVPAHYDHGGKFRLLAKKIARNFGLEPYRELSKYYHSQWSKFINLKYDADFCADTIIQEIQRNLKVTLSRILGFKQVSNEDPENYLRSLLKRRKVTLTQLYRKIKNRNKMGD